MAVRLNPELAERFIKRIATYTQYNVNIMDANGYIIAASRNPERIGSFHEAAYHMIQERREMILLDDKNEFFNAKKGVNLLLLDDGEPLGVVGVTGEPEKVQEIALIIKMALETMLAYENQQYVKLYQKNKQEQFYTALFEESPVSREKLEILAEQLGYEDQCIRIPVILVFPDTVKMDAVLQKLQRGFLSEQDMCWSINNHRILVYRKLEGKPEEIFSSWRQMITEWLDFPGTSIPYIRACVGTLQCRLHYYGKGFAHCAWLEENVSADDRVVCFADHTDGFFSSQIPVMELHGVYNTYDRYLDDDFKTMYTSMMGSLCAHNYNLVASSQELFVHKNTLAFRLKKIRSLFDVDPFHSGEERTFLNGLYLYLKQRTQ